MTYELAKKLKDAGFPQRGEGKIIGISGGLNLAEGTEPLVSGEYYIPTLEELIEACGDELLKLEHIFDGGMDNNEKLWVAYSQNHLMVGETPIESITHLWLALNNGRNSRTEK